MCFGGDGGASQRAAAEQQRLDALARQRQDELNRLAAAREAQATAQQAEMAKLQQAQQDAQANQQRTVAGLQAQGDAQQKQLAGQKLATQAAAQSLRVLATTSGQSSAPTAQASRPKQEARVRATTATNDLRIGSSGRGAGVGVNLGG
jgi:hypothetical protein